MGGSGWPIVGNPIDPFTLELLGGGTFSTAEHKGRILVLVFWNGTPEGGTFPAMVHLATQFHDHGVALVLVNARDDEEAIRRFLDQRRWKIPVAKDRDGSVSQRYLFKSTNRSFAMVVDKAGLVQSLYSDSAGEPLRLRAELRALLAGKQVCVADEDEDDG